MSLRSTSHSLLGAAIAATLLLASPALAKPVDADLRVAAGTSSLAGTPAPKQDLRGEHARDAERAITQASPKQDLRGEHARDAARTPPMWASPDASAPVAAKSAPVADAGGGRPETWLIIAIGLAGAIVLALGTTSAVRARSAA
jgi:hypothetical protein